MKSGSPGSRCTMLRAWVRSLSCLKRTPRSRAWGSVRTRISGASVCRQEGGCYHPHALRSIRVPQLCGLYSRLSGEPLAGRAPDEEGEEAADGGPLETAEQYAP